MQQQRDPFPYIMGGIIGALVVGLGLVILLLVTNKSNNNVSVPIASATVDPNAPTVAAQATPPRMPIEEFKTLYDGPNRPLIIDVRALPSFDEGHIAGAVSFPEADADLRIGEIPKDKLVVAYCQWPAENESARVAQKLHDDYGYSYDNLKVLLGGWNTWKEKNGADPTGYPIAVANSSTPKIPDKTAPTVAPGGAGAVDATAPVVIAPVVIAPAGTKVP